MMEERVKKGSLHNPSPLLWVFCGSRSSYISTTLSFGRIVRVKPHTKIQNWPEREGIQKKPPLVTTNEANYGRGFHLFILKWHLFEKTKNRQQKYSCVLPKRIMRTHYRWNRTRRTIFRKNRNVRTFLHRILNVLQSNSFRNI